MIGLIIALTIFMTATPMPQVDHVIDQMEAQTEELPEDQMEELLEDQTEEQMEELPEDQAEEQTEEVQEDQTEELPEEQTEVQTEENEGVEEQEVMSPTPTASPMPTPTIIDYSDNIQHIADDINVVRRDVDIILITMWALLGAIIGFLIGREIWTH